MSDLQIFDFEGNNVRTVLIDGEPWFVGKDVCNILEIKNSRETFSSVDEKDKLGVRIMDRIGREQNTTVINKSALKRVISKSRKPQAREIAQYFGLECYFSPVEVDCLRVIISAFQHLNPIQQFQVSGYRIDLYFPKEKIAVECDEHEHSNYDKEKEIARQDQITKLLRCKFIRFNPNEQNFNIGNVINKIIMLVY